MKNKCECNRCQLGIVGYYYQWACEYTGEHKTYEEKGVCQGACKGDTCMACGCCECYHDARVCQWTEDGTDDMVTARVTLQIVIDVPDGISIGTAVKQLINNGVHDAYCVEILLSEPTNLSAKELNEKQSYLNRLSNTKQGDETNE